MTKTAVVILNYNGEKLLPQFLPSVIQYSIGADVYVADNASTDNSLQILQDKFPSVKVIALEKNYGFCGGYNRALNAIDSEYYVLLNSDVEVTPGWLDPLVRILDNDPNAAAVQPKILSYRDRHQFEYAGAAGGFIDSLGYPFCRGRIFTTVEIDQHQYDDELPIFWSTGACFIIRSKVYHHFSGLDEDLFAHMEEIDLCWKIHRTRQKVMYSGKSSVYHLGAGTLGYDNPKKVYLNFRNGLILIYKHLDPAELLYKLPVRLMLDWLAALVFLVQGKPKNALSVAQAHVDFGKALAKHRTKRKIIREQYPSYSRKTIYRGSILLDYYLKRIRRYPSNPR
ncbi:MAG TPA: glycosyltransferase family 2 protein [Chryseosolibacter sp.]